jgi:hypothetical protein
MTDRSSEYIVEVDGDHIDVSSSFHHYEGSDDYTNTGSRILEIKDAAGHSLEPVWKDTWTELVPGISTRRHDDCQQVRLKASACPVRIRVQHFNEYVSYSDREFCNQSRSESWTLYQAVRA